MNQSWRDKLVELFDSYPLGPRDKPLLTLRELAASGQLSEGMCRFHYTQLLLHPPRCAGSLAGLADPPTIQEWRGVAKSEAPIGSLTEVDGAEFGVRISDRVHHWAISGCTDAGKSVALRGILKAVAGSAVHVMFQLKGDVPDADRLIGVPCLQFNATGSPAFALQAPAGVSVRDWAMTIAVIVASRCGLKHATTSIARMITWVVEHLNVNPGDASLWPDFQLLCDVAVAAPPDVFAAKSDYERSGIQVLDGLAHALGPFARSFRGIDLERDFISKGTSVVIDLGTVAPPAQWVVIDILLSQLLIGRLARHQKTDRTEILVSIDESDLLVADYSNATFPGEQSPLLRLLRQGREYGLMACLSINDLARASDSLLNNIQNWVVMKQESPACVAKATRALMLNPRAAGLLTSLERGEAVLRIAGWPEPVLGKTTFVPPHRGDDRMPAARFDAVPAKRLFERPELKEALDAEQGELGRARKGAAEAPNKLLQHVHDVIADWIKRPGKPLSRTWDSLGIDAPGKQKAIRAMLAPKFADLVDERFGSAKVAILEPTEAGYALVGRRMPEGLGRGGTVHRNGAWWACDWAVMQSYETFLEWLVPGTNHPADVGYFDGNRNHVIEIAVKCFENLADAVRASLLVSKVVETVTIVTTMKSKHADVRRRLAAAADLSPVMDRVHLSTFDFYLREVYG